MRDPIITQADRRARQHTPVSLQDYYMYTTSVTSLAADADGVYDMFFVNVAVSDAGVDDAYQLDAGIFVSLMNAHRTAAVQSMVTPLALVNNECVPYTYVEIGAWLGGAQVEAFRFMALAVHFELARMITPYDVQPDIDRHAAMLLARMGMVGIIATRAE